MSDIGFDPRPYCERLAKVCPDRFKIDPDDGFITDGGGAWYDWNGTQCMCAFFVPLADERKIQPGDVSIGRDDPREWRESDLLESIIAAVVESFESEVKG